MGTKIVAYAKWNIPVQAADGSLVEFFKDLIKGTIKDAFNDAFGMRHRVRCSLRMEGSQTLAEERREEVYSGGCPLGKL